MLPCRQLERPGTVRYWTDFLKVTLHPRSVLQLPGLWHGVSDFDGFGAGRQALAGEEAREEARDRIRMFAEECDLLQACAPSCPLDSKAVRLLGIGSRPDAHRGLAFFYLL